MQEKIYFVSEENVNAIATACENTDKAYNGIWDLIGIISVMRDAVSYHNDEYGEDIKIRYETRNGLDAIYKLAKDKYGDIAMDTAQSKMNLEKVCFDAQSKAHQPKQAQPDAA